MEVTIKVPKETNELAQAIVELVKAAKDALKDGWQPGQDLPIIFTAAIAQLPIAIGGIEKIGEEFKLDPVAFVKAFNLAGYDIAELFINK